MSNTKANLVGQVSADIKRRLSPQHYQQLELKDHFAETYFVFRLFLGVFGLMIPVGLWLLTYLGSGVASPNWSISGYYHSDFRSFATFWLALSAQSAFV